MHVKNGYGNYEEIVKISPIGEPKLGYGSHPLGIGTNSYGV